MNDDAKRIELEKFGLELADQSILESIAWVLIRDDPSFLSRLRHRLDAHQPKALRLLPPQARRAFEERLTGFLLDLESHLPD